jgi:diguanylate cyclase (GGDEF)-like protein
MAIASEPPAASLCPGSGDPADCAAVAWCHHHHLPGPPVRDRLHLLQGILLFRDLAAADLLPLALVAEQVTFRAGEAIVEQGDPGDDVFLIVSGRAQVVARLEQAGITTEATLSWLGAGESVGELSLLDGEPRPATCAAVEETTCLRLRRVDFLTALREHWALTRALLASLAQRLRRADARLVEFARDPLTGLYSRGALADLYARELVRLRFRATGASATPDRTVAMLYLDVDRFKEINDQHGHSTGDDVLRAAAVLLMALTRRSDVVARHGGDEFVVLLADVDAETAARIAARIRRSLREQPPGPVPFTVSIGVALADPAAPQSLEALLRAADAEMYREKAAGAARP